MREKVFSEGKERFSHGQWLVIFIPLLFFVFIVNQGKTEETQSLGIAKMPLTLAEAIDLALKKNAAIHSAKQGVVASQFLQKSAKTGFLPVFSATSSFTRFDEEPTSGGTPISEKENYRLQVGFEQPIYTGGAIKNNYKLSGQAIEGSQYQYQNKVKEIIYQVRERYLTVLKSLKAREVNEQEVQQLKTHEEIAQILYDSGMIIKADLLKIKVQLANISQQLIRAEHAVELSIASLCSLLDLPLETSLELEELLSYTSYPLELQDCLDKALRERPEIQKAIIELNQAKTSVDLAKSDYYPKFFLTGSFDLAKEAFSWEAEQSFQLMAQMRWAFWEWKKTDYDVEAAFVGVRQAEDAKKLIGDSVILEVKQAYLKLREAEKNISVVQEAIEQADENFRINEESFKENTVTSTDLLDAEILLAQTKLNYYTALFDYNLAIAALERAMGMARITIM